MSTTRNCKSCGVSFVKDHHANLYCPEHRDTRNKKKSTAQKRRKKAKPVKTTKKVRSAKEERDPAERWWGMVCNNCGAPWLGGDDCMECEEDQTHRIG